MKFRDWVMVLFVINYFFHLLKYGEPEPNVYSINMLVLATCYCLLYILDVFGKGILKKKKDENKKGERKKQDINKH
jgi:hypothetical protein